MKISMALIALSLAGAVHAAPFEGELNFKISGRTPGGVTSGFTYRVYLSPMGMRSENVIAGDQHFVLRLRARPGVKYRVNATRQTIMEEEESKEQDLPPAYRESFAAAKLGEEWIKGHACVHVLLKGDKGTKIEQWIARDIEGLEHWLTTSPDVSEGQIGALRKVQVDGFPMKAITTFKGQTISVEALEPERRFVPRSLFDVTGLREIDD